ncbi:hypothetical protein F4604DRAFT_1683363 [Suillus subluteus]|nr:hypothetical protein F4604DRAFT_1683363 [Suillus subluteus]
MEMPRLGTYISPGIEQLSGLHAFGDSVCFEGDGENPGEANQGLPFLHPDPEDCELLVILNKMQQQLHPQTQMEYPQAEVPIVKYYSHYGWNGAHEDRDSQFWQLCSIISTCDINVEPVYACESSDEQWSRGRVPEKAAAMTIFITKIASTVLLQYNYYTWNLSWAILMVQATIYIHDWWLSPELQLRCPNEPKYHLGHLLQRKAREGVKIHIILHQEVSNRTTPTDSK